MYCMYILAVVMLCFYIHLEFHLYGHTVCGPWWFGRCQALKFTSVPVCQSESIAPVEYTSVCDYRRTLKAFLY
jgi:hypothetical protein